MKQFAAVSALALFYLLAVHLPHPRFSNVLPVLVLSLWFGPGSMARMEDLGWGLLLGPSAALFILALLPKVRNAVWRHALLASSWACVVLALLDLPLILLFVGGLSTPSAMAVAVIIGLSVVAWTALLASLTAEALGRPRTRPSPLRWITVTSITAVSVWSLAVMAAAWSSTIRLADGRPYCIVQPGGARDYTGIHSALALRGSHFYTDATGYKDSSRWYFNVILVIEDPDGRLYFNWSYRNWRFDHLPSTGYIADFREACVPTPGFLPDLLVVGASGQGKMSRDMMQGLTA